MFLQPPTASILSIVSPALPPKGIAAVIDIFVESNSRLDDDDFAGRIGELPPGASRASASRASRCRRAHVMATRAPDLMWEVIETRMTHRSKADTARTAL